MKNSGGGGTKQILHAINKDDANTTRAKDDKASPQYSTGVPSSPRDGMMNMAEGNLDTRANPGVLSRPSGMDGAN